MNQQETNKLIAEFMGYKVVDKPKVVNGENFFEYLDENSKYIYCNSLLRYNDKWDWLMPVVEKIREKQMFSFINIYNQAMKEGCEIRVFDINNNNIFYTYPKVNTEEKTLLNVTHGAVVEFIKWYNKNK